MTEFPDGYPEDHHHHPHLRLMDLTYVLTACDEIDKLQGLSYGAKLEAAAWRLSRTPHDAIRLTNMLWYHNQGVRDPVIARLIADIDARAEECAGVPLPNKHQRGEA